MITIAPAPLAHTPAEGRSTGLAQVAHDDAHADPFAVRDLEEARRLALREADSAARRAAIEAVSARRSELIERHPTDPRRGPWLLDDAEDALLAGLPTAGLDLICVFGWPSGAERAEVARVAERALLQLDEARRALDSTLRRLEPGARDDGELERLRRQLADRETGARLPALTGIATGLLAAVAGSPGDAEAFNRRTVDALSPVLIELDGTARTMARVHLGLALAALGQGDDARSMVRSLNADMNPSPTDLLRTALTEVEIAHRLDGARVALDRLDPAIARLGALRVDPFVRLLLADLRARLLWSLRDPQAGIAHVALLEELPPRDRASVRSALLPRLAERFPDGVDAPRTALVTVARAQRGAGDPSTRAAALAALERILRDENAAPVERVAAGITLAEVLDDLDDASGAIRSRLFLATLLAGEPEAPQAIERAASDALRFWLAARSDETAALLRETLATLLSRYPGLSSYERWRHEAARLAHATGDRESLITTIDGTPSDSPWRGENLLLKALDRRRSADLDDALRRREAWQSVAELAARAAVAMDAAPAPGDRRGADAYTAARSARARRAADMLAAEALLELGRAEETLAALDALATLGPDRSTPIDQTGDRAGRADIARLRIVALQSLGRTDEAEREIRRVVVELGDAATRPLVTILRSVRARYEHLRDTMRHDEANALAHRDLPALAEALEDLLAAGHVEDDATESVRWLVADAYLESERAAEALPHLDLLLEGRPDALEYLLARGLALAALGGVERQAEAMALLKRVSAARAIQRDTPFWRAELGMLRILIDVDARDRSGVAAQVRPRIAQLRLRDPQMGGERWRREFEQLERLAR